MRLPDLRVSPSSQPTPGYGGVQVVPQRSGTGEQLQEFGGGLLAAGVGAARVADYLQDQLDEAKSQTEFNLYAEEVRKIERTYEAQVGEGAVNGLGRTLGAINDARKAAEARLGNDTQHTLFRSRADVHDFHVRDRVERHGIDQTMVYQIGAQTAGAKGSLDDYVSLWQRGMPQDPAGAAQWQDAVRLARETGIRQINKVADLRGDSPEVRKLAVLAHTTEMHSGVLESLGQDPQQAAAYLQQHRGEMSTGAVSRFDRMIRRTLEQDRTFLLAEGYAQATPSLLMQRALVVRDTQDGKITSEEAQSVWDKLRTIDMEKSQQHQALRQEFVRGLSQQFAQDEALTTDTLAPATQARIDELGVRADAIDAEAKVRADRLARKRKDETIDPIADVRDMATLDNALDTLAKASDQEIPGRAEQIARLQILKQVLVQKQKAYVESLPPSVRGPRSYGGPVLSDEEVQRLLMQHDYEQSIQRRLGESVDAARRILFPGSGR